MKIRLVLFVSAASFIALSRAQEKAEVDIRVSGACSPIYLQRKGVDMSTYRPAIRFNPDKIQLIPRAPVIPGCIKIKAEGVEILRPVKNLVAEVEMRIGGSPDPTITPLPCSKKVDERVNQYMIDHSMFCDFCKQLKAQQSKIQVDRHEPTGSVSEGGVKPAADDCQCESMQPGLYDIETEMCTPELGADDAKDYIPPEIQNNILEKRPISMFITVYLMDMEQRGRESYLSSFGRAILQRRIAKSTVACFLLGIDVKLAGPPLIGLN